MSNKKKMLVLGMDGLDPVLLEKYVKSGVLPHFARLMKDGGYERLQTSNPPQSPVAWATFISGANPGVHDVFDFVVRNPQTYRPEVGMTEAKLFSGLLGPSLQTKRKGGAFWDELEKNGVKSVILHCPVTFPAEKMKGRLLSGMGTPDIRGTQGVFSLYTSALPTDNEKDIHGRVIHVSWENDTITSELIGPKMSASGKKKDVGVPLMIKRVSEQKISIHVQGQSFDLAVGDWSPWVRVKFPLGFMKNVSGVCRFQLAAITPELKIYMTAVNLDPLAPAFAISYPPSYSADLCHTLGDFYTQGMPYDTWALNDGGLSEEEFLKQAYGILDENIKLLDLELSRFDEGMMFSYFGITDLIQHMFWRYIDADHPNRGRSTNPEVTQAIANVYKKMDELLGRALDKIDADTQVVILSDHGFGSYRRTVHVNSWLRDQGYLVLKNEEKIGTELFLNVDWEQTRAYAVGFGGIYFNQFGREKNGVVYVGADADALRAEITAKLLEWKDHGHAVAKKVYAAKDLYQGPYAQNGPDLFIGFAAGYRASWQTGLGAAPKNLVDDNMKLWSGDHLCDPELVPGVLLFRHKISVTKPTLTTVPRLILDYFGVHAE